MDDVGIIITTYENNSLWEEAVASVIMQTICKDITLVLSDDGTPNFNIEESYDRVIALGGSHLKNVIVRKNEVNVGTVKNINMAAKEINCKYLMLLAGDDQLYSETVIEDYIKIISQMPQYSAIFGQSLEFSADMSKPIEPIDSEDIYEKKHKLLKESGKHLFTSLAINCFVPSSGMMYKYEFLEKVGWFNEKYRLVEDWPMFLKMARDNYKIYYSKSIAVKHRTGGVSTADLFANKQFLYQTDLVNIIVNEVLSNIDCIVENKREYIKKMCVEKLAIYNLRYNFSGYSIYNKFTFLMNNSFFLIIIINKILRRLRNERKII